MTAGTGISLEGNVRAFIDSKTVVLVHNRTVQQLVLQQCGRASLAVTCPQSPGWLCYNRTRPYCDRQPYRHYWR